MTPSRQTARLAAALLTFALATPAKAQEPSAEPPLDPAPAAQPDPPPEPQADDGLPMRIAGATLFGVGLAAIVAGTITGLEALSKQDESNDTGACSTNNFCTPAGVALRDDALLLANVSTGLFVGGAAATVAGTLLYFLAPDTPVSEPIWQPLLTFAPSPEGVAFQLRGSF